SHGAGPLASVLRWGPRHTMAQHTGAPGDPAPGRAARSDRRGHGLARRRSADPVQRRVPRSGFRPLGVAPARRGVLPRLLLLVPPALGTAGPLDARACRRGWPPAGRGDRTAGIGPGITQDA